MRTCACTHCGLVTESPPAGKCPLCGGVITQLVTNEAGDDEAAPQANDKISFELAYTTFQCDSNDCDTTFLLTELHACPSCGRNEESKDPAAERRASAYSTELKQLGERTSWWREESIRFAERGPRPELDGYIEWLRSRAMTQPLELLDRAMRILRTTEWDQPDSVTTQRSFRELLETGLEMGRLIEALAQQPPPLALLSVHRQATRALVALGDALVEFTSLLDSPYYPKVHMGMDRGQRKLDLATDRTEQVSRIIQRVDRILTTPGFWSIEDEYDTGRIAWEGIGQEVATLSQAAAMVRRTFDRVPGLQALSDEQAFMLMPAAAIGASLQDPERLTERAIAARKLLDKADEQHPGWIEDPELLVEQTWRGHRQLIEQVVRLGYEIRNDAPRRLLMQTGLDVFAKFYEGPLRTLGGIVAIAAEAADDADCRLDAGTVETYKPARVSEAFSRAAPILVDGVLPQLRHAEAHYDFQLDSEGVSVRFHHTKSKPGHTEWFSDEDFFEQMINLNEALIAIELAVIPWVQGRPEPSIQAHIEHRSRTRDTARETLRAIAGLKGWTDIRFHMDGDTLRLYGVYRGPTDGESALALLPVVSAAWELFEGTRRIDLEPALGVPLTLISDEFPDGGEAQLEKLHRTALLIGRTLEAAGDQSSAAVQTRWYVIPGVLLPAKAADVLLSNPDAQEAGELVSYVSWSIRTLSNMALDEDPASWAQELIPLLHKLKRAVGAWRTPKASPQLASRAQGDIRTITGKLFALAERCQRTLDSEE